MNKNHKHLISPSLKIIWSAIQGFWYLGVVVAIAFPLFAIAALVSSPDVIYEFPLNASIDAELVEFANKPTQFNEQTGFQIAQFGNPILAGPVSSLDIMTKLLMLGIMAIVIVAFLGIVYNLKEFLTIIRNRHPFDSANSIRLKKIASFVIIAGPFLGSMQYLLSLNLLNHCGLSAAGMKPNLDLNLYTVLLGLLILVIAEVFQTGNKLQMEQDLTV